MKASLLLRGRFPLQQSAFVSQAAAVRRCLAWRARGVALILAAVAIGVAVMPETLEAQTTATLRTVHVFATTNPGSGLIQGPDGTLYGSTLSDTGAGAGTLFSTTTSGALSTLYTFNYDDGYNPQGGVTLGPDGTLYCVTSAGGQYGDKGTIFTYLPSNSRPYTYHEFDGVNGKTPLAPPVLGSDGLLYGTTSQGGANGFGTIYQQTPYQQHVVLHHFTGTDGAAPQAVLLDGGDGYFYGVTPQGGANGAGVVFRINTYGEYTVLHNFSALDHDDLNSDGFQPNGPLIRGNGAFYGVTARGGPNEGGTAFRITAGGTLTVLHAFSSTTEIPTSVSGPLCLATDGNFYGTVFGQVFQITPAGAFSTFYTFSTDPTRSAYSGVIQGKDGNLYGSTAGTVFQLTLARHLTVLNSFDQTNDLGPIGPLLPEGSTGLFGMTSNGGAFGKGSIYFMRQTSPSEPVHVFATLHSFNGDDGAYPRGMMTKARDNSYVGTTAGGGLSSAGTVFHLTSGGTFSSLHSFIGSDGNGPLGGLIESKSNANDFTGVTAGGGANGIGAAYEISSAGGVTLLHSFTQADGAEPQGPLFTADGRSFYGTGYAGGAQKYGVLFLLDGIGATTVEHTFAYKEGIGPRGRLIQDGSGSLYGATAFSGSDSEGGIIFKFTSAGVFSILADFSGLPGGISQNGEGPQGNFIQASDGYFYGTCQGAGIYDGGTIFRFDSTGSKFEVLYAGNPGDFRGSGPGAGLIQTSDGSFYGVMGNERNGVGTVFQFTLLPEFTSANEVPAIVNQPFFFQVTATNGVTSYSIDDLPEGLSFSSAGIFSGQPTSKGTYFRGVSATNSFGTTTTLFKFDITDPAPVITSALNPPSRQGVAFAYQIAATNSPANYSTHGLPAGLGLSTSTGKISGTPTGYGTFPVIIRATNDGGTGAATLNLVVKQAIPVITSNLNPPSLQGVAFSYQITATNKPTAYGASGLPSGLTINQTTGQIHGTPTVSGTFNVLIAAFNSGGAGTATLKLVVKAAPPVITSPLSESATTDVAFNYQITAKNNPTSYGASGLPAGLKIDQTTGKISGAPTTAGTFMVKIAAFNGGGSGSASLTITVKAGPPVITSALSDSAHVGTAYSYQITATNHPTSYGEANLPEGLGIDQATGKISGTPTAKGVYTVTIAAFNSVGSGSAKLTLTIN